MGSYTYQAILAPGEYEILVDSEIELYRPPFIKFNFKELREKEYSLSINSKWCPTLRHTKLVVRALKVGDVATISFQAWVPEVDAAAGAFRTSHAIQEWLVSNAWLYGGKLLCKNLSSYGMRMHLENDVKKQVNAVTQTFSPSEWMIGKTIEDVVKLFDHLHPGTNYSEIMEMYWDLTAVHGVDVKKELHKLYGKAHRGYYGLVDEPAAHYPSTAEIPLPDPVKVIVKEVLVQPTFEQIAEMYDELKFMRYFNEKRGATLKIPKKVEHYEISDENSIIDALEHNNDNVQTKSFDELMTEVFGADFAQAV